VRFSYLLTREEFFCVENIRILLFHEDVVCVSIVTNNLILRHLNFIITWIFTPKF